jgi:hypothetical protein
MAPRGAVSLAADDCSRLPRVQKLECEALHSPVKDERFYRRNAIVSGRRARETGSAGVFCV